VARVFDGDALSSVGRSLGLGGQSPQTIELEDGSVVQTLDVAGLVRRGRTLAGTSGVFNLVLENVHAASGELFTTINPYNQATNTTAPWPNPVPRGFEIWLIGATASRRSGTGTVDAILQIGDLQIGIGEDDSGAAVGAMSTVVALWNSTFPVLLTTSALFFSGVQPIFAPLHMRLPRSGDPSLTFVSNASALATYRCQVMVGLFPTGLGQDAAF